MKLKRIDYYTIAGLAIFLIVEIGYYVLDQTGVLRSGISFNPADITLNTSQPQLSFPNLNMDWFNSMDPISRTIFGFFVILIIGTATGCAGIYMKYRKTRAK